MKKWMGYIACCMLIVLASCGKKTNWRYTLDKNSTQPFGLYIAYNQLEQIYPYANKETIYNYVQYVSENRHDLTQKKNTLLISITDGIYLSDEEASDLYIYVSNGGQVLMVSDKFSAAIDSIFEINNIMADTSLSFAAEDSTSMHQLWWADTAYEYTINMPFARDYFGVDSGYGFRDIYNMWETNIIVKNIGDGQIIFSNSPEMFTNYALLSDNNIQYYEQLLSYFGIETYQIKWFSKYNLRPKERRSSSNFMQLLKQKPYRYAFFVLLTMAVLFLIFETRRKQRIVSVVPPISNDSLAFTETIGKLYYGEKDNRNLAGKMIQYYLEHIRSAHNLHTAHLNNEMAQKLARKLNTPTAETVEFINYLNNLLTASSLSEQEIKKLYNTLKKYS